MQLGNVTVGTDPKEVPVVRAPYPVTAVGAASQPPIEDGVRLTHRTSADATENAYVTLNPSATPGGPDTNLLPKGALGDVSPYPLPPSVFAGQQKVYVVADAADQIVDWSAN